MSLSAPSPLGFSSPFVPRSATPPAANEDYEMPERFKPESSQETGSILSAHSVKQLNPSSPQDLTVLKAKEKEVEQLLLTETGKLSPVEWQEWQRWLADNIELGGRYASYTLGFLEKVLPSHILENSHIKRQFEMHYRNLNYEGAILEALDLGLTGLAAIYKMKLIVEVQNTIDKIKASYEDPSQIPKIVQEWETQLDLEVQDLRLTSQGLAVRSAKGLVEFTKTSFEMLAPKSLPFGERLIQGLGAVGALLGTILAGIMLYKADRASSRSAAWMESFRKWKEHAQPKIQINIQGVNAANANSLEDPAALRRRFKEELIQLINQSKDMEEVREKLEKIDITLDQSIKNKTQLETKLENLEDSLLIQYSEIRVLNDIIDTTQNLLEKRQAIAQKKLIQLRPKYKELLPKIKEFKEREFSNQLDAAIKLASNPEENQETLSQFLAELKLDLPPTVQTKAQLLTLKNSPDRFQAEFEKWFKRIPTDTLLKDYIDHQETITHLTKNALIQMVDKKHEIEKTFFQFKLTESATTFALSILGLSVSVALLILGLASIPFGGGALIALGLTGFSIVCGLGFSGVAHYFGMRYRPSQYTLEAFTYSIGFKILFAKIHKAIHSYFHELEVKKVEKLALSVEATLYPKSQQVQSQLKAAEDNLRASRKKMKELETKVEALEERRKSESWQDFALHAQLQVNADPQIFDTLRAFKEAFERCDLSLLDKETKIFLETQLGMNLAGLEKEARKDPDAIKKALQNFFIMGDSELNEFIKKQDALLANDLIKPLPA